MKKILIFIMITVVTIGSLKAQFSVGVAGGMSNTTHKIDYGYATSFKDYKAMGGSAMAFGRYDFNKWLGIRVDAGWIQRNYTHVLEIKYENTSTTERKEWKQYRNYLMVPVTASFFYDINGWRIFGDVGGFAGYWLGGKTKYNYKYGDETEPEMTEKYVFDKKRDGRFDAGLVARAGFSYTFDCNLFLMFDYTNYIGMVNNHYTGSSYITQPAYDYTYTLQLGIGYRFR